MTRGHKQLDANKGSKAKGFTNQKASLKRDKFPPRRTRQRTNHLEKDYWYKGKPHI